MRSILGAGLRAPASSAGEPPMLFTTPSGEQHEFGVLLAALAAAGAGANVVYLGPNLPSAEVARAAGELGAAVVVLGLAALELDAPPR